MPTLELTVLLKLDGVEVSGFPLVHREAVDSVQPFEYQKATGGGYVALPTNQLATLHALVVRSLDQPVTVRLNGQSDAGVSLAAGGLLLVFDGTLNAGVATNATVQNASGSTTTVQGVGGGT